MAVWARFGEEADEAVREALTHSRELGRLVDQLLEAARIDVGDVQLVLRPGSVSGLVGRVVDAFRHHAGRSGIRLETDVPDRDVTAVFDAERLEMVLRNLVSNALRFTPEGGRVCVAANAAGPAASVAISVSDTGVGIDPEDIPHVFERFYQGRHADPAVAGGTGIGLAIAREITTLHGGTITVESELGRGTEFNVTIPRGHATPRQEPQPTAPARPRDAASAEERAVRDADTDTPDRPTVLVVDEHPDVLAFLERTLEREYVVRTATNGAEALHLARSERPDLVVSDVMMPVMDGMELLRAIRTDPELDDLPVILLTARSATEDLLAGIEQGADAYVTKPFQPRLLRSRVAGLLESRRRLQQRAAEAGRELPVLEVPLRPGPSMDRDHDFLAALYRAIAARLDDEDFDVEALADALGMSRATLYRRLDDAEVGGAMEVIRTYRLEQAAVWLRQTDAKVADIAYGVGFRSVPHFSARFKTRFGSSPTDYRRDRE